jgi:hypothetical protein
MTRRSGEPRSAPVSYPSWRSPTLSTYSYAGAVGSVGHFALLKTSPAQNRSQPAVNPPSAMKSIAIRGDKKSGEAESNLVAVS